MKLFIFLRYYAIGVLFLLLLQLNATSQTQTIEEKTNLEEKKVEQQEKIKEAKNAPEQGAQNKPLPEEEIKKLRKHQESIPLVWKLLEENPNLEFAKQAIQFILGLDPIEPQVIQAIIKLSCHPESEIRKYAIEQILQAGENVFTSLRHILKTGTLEEKEKTAELLARHGQREIDTFLELLQSTNSIDQEIAQKKLIEMGSLVIVLSRLVELIEINPYKGLQKNVLYIFKEIGKNNIPALFISVKDGKGIGRELVIQAMLEIGKECIQPAINVVRLNPDPILKQSLCLVIDRIGESSIIDILPFIDAPTPEVREIVRDSIKKFNEKALPVLSNIIQNSDNSQKIYALKAIAYIGPGAVSMIDLIKPFMVQENELQLPAVLAIQSMGDASEKVIPELQTAFKSKTSAVRATAANALANSGVKALPALSLLRGRLKINQFGDALEVNAEVRASICKAIGNIGAEAESAIPELMACLKDIDENVVCSAAEALGKIGPKAARAADSLIQVFSMYGLRERKAAAEALAKMGSMVLQKVVKALRYDADSDVSSREGAAMTLRYMGKTAAPAMYSLIMALRMDIDIIKKEAAAALGEIGHNSSEIIKNLIDTSSDDSPMVREEVAKALSKMGKTAVPHILLALRRISQEEGKITLIQALGYLGKDATESIDFLMRELRYAQAEVLKETIRSLGKIGIQGDSIIPVFIEILKKSYDNEVHRLLVEAIVQSGEKSIEQIIPLVTEESPKAKKSALEILEQMGDSVTPYLLRILNSSQDEALLSEALSLLGKRGNALDELLKFLKHPSENIRKTLVGVLSNIGLPCVPKLVQLIQTTDNTIEKTVARKIIANIGVPSIPHLITALKAEASSTRRSFLVGTISDMGEKAQMAIIPMVEFLVLWQGEDRRLAAQCLGKIGVTSIPYLVELLNHKDKDIQQMAIFSLGETRSPEAILYLLKSLKNPQLLSIVVDAIIKMKSMAVPILSKALSDSDLHIRFACAAVLVEIADPEALEPLKKQESLETNPMLLYMIQNAIKKCTK